ncbi:hypothetical protein THAOC_25051, partial [Thalassiosira oceanica]
MALLLARSAWCAMLRYSSDSFNTENRQETRQACTYIRAHYALVAGFDASLIVADIAEEPPRAQGRPATQGTTEEASQRSPDQTTSPMSSESTSPDDRGPVDATVSPRPSPPGDVSTQEIVGSTNASDSAASPLVQEVPRNGTTASTIRAINDDDPPIPVGQVADHEKETKGPQLHDGPPGPPRFPQELDDSLAKKVEKERAAFPALEDRLRHEDIGSGKRAAQETEGSTNVGDSTAAPMVQREVIQGGEMVSTIHSMNEDDPPIPVLQVVDHEKSEGNQARRVANEFGRSSDHPRYNVLTVHTTMGASVASAAEVDPPVVGSNTSTNTTSPGAAGRAATNSGATTAIVGTRTIVLPQAMMIKPGDDDEPEPVIAEQVTSVALPFYRRKGFYLWSTDVDRADSLTVNNNQTLRPTNIPTENPTLRPTNDVSSKRVEIESQRSSCAQLVSYTDLISDADPTTTLRKPTNNPTASNIPTTIPTSPPSENPTLRPTNYYDFYPEETSYKLERIASEDGQETELASHRGSNGDKNHEESICLEDGLYSFSFYDSYGDGFNGEYSLTLVPGERIIMRDNSVSRYGEKILFRLPFNWSSTAPSSSKTPTASPTLIPSLSPSSSKTPTAFPTLIPSLPPSSSKTPTAFPTLIPSSYSPDYDSYPDETSYKLEKIASEDGQETELASHSGSAGDKNHEESICLDDGLYSFSFYDSHGDGFNGEYSLTLVPGETIIVQDNSESLYGEQVLFRLPFDQATVDVEWIGSDGQLLPSLSPSSSPTLTLSPSSSSQPSSSSSPSC